MLALLEHRHETSSPKILASGNSAAALSAISAIETALRADVVQQIGFVL
jgi:hypothetical protein